MVLTVTLNAAIDKMVMLNGFELHKLHRLHPDEKSITLAGGKGVNIAIALHTLGCPVMVTGFAAGHSGQLLTETIRKIGITTNFVFTEGNTRTNLSILDAKNETLTAINEPGGLVAQDDQTFFLENYERLLNLVNMVVLGGSMPEGMHFDFYAKLVELAANKKIPVIAHVSPKYFDAILSEKISVLIPDLRSYPMVRGKQSNIIQAMVDLGNELLMENEHLEYVIFGNRIENVVALSRSKSYILRPSNLKIVNMLGYADSFVAGFVHGLYYNQTMLDSLRLASACGLTNVEHLCKDLKNKELVVRNISRIEVEEIV